MKKTVAIWIGVFVLTFALLFVLIKYSGRSNVNQTFPEVSEIRQNDHAKGADSAKTIVVEYGDFQCPGCAAVAPLLKRLQNETGDDTLIVYRHFPLPMHAHAVLAASFAEAAGLQGKFWEMHDMLFDGQATWVSLGNAMPVFLQYGRDLGLDMERLERDINGDEVRRKLEQDRADTIKFGLNSTPTIFVNGRRIQPSSYEELKSLTKSAARL